jgi:microcystin-dependent protein
MPLETITYISDLNPANPSVADGLVQGDDHLRGIKAALKNTLPNFTAGALTSTQAQIDALVAALTFSGGQIRARGLAHPGHILDWPKLPLRFSAGGVAAGGQAAVDWLECDGSVYNIADFPDLGGFLLNSYGGNGTTTFAVPNLKDTGRFRRSRTNTLNAGTAQGNALGSHAHTGTSDAGGVDHVHFYSGTTTGQSNDHSHAFNYAQASGGNTGVQQSGGGTFFAGNVTGSGSTGGVNADHTHIYSGNTGGASAVLHTHTFATSFVGGTENRPESFAVVCCIKT